MIRVSHGNHRAGRDQRHRHLREVRHRLRGSDDLVLVEEHLGDKGFVGESSLEDVGRTLGAGFLSEDRLPKPARQVALLRGGAQLLAPAQLHRNGDHLLHDLRHLRGARAGGHANDVSTVGEDPRIVRVHSRHRGYARILGGLADLRTGQTVTSRFEGWSGDHHVRLMLIDGAPDGG